MGIFDRFSTMLRSNINDLISRAENPEKMLNQLILDMKSNLAKAKQEAAAAIADEKKLQADAEALKKQAEDWERRAMLAVQEGRDDLATQALMRYNEPLQGAQQLHETWVKHKADTESLKGQLRQLNDKIEEAKRKKNILVARAKRAEAQQRIQETMSGMNDKSAFESFDRMAEKIEAIERKALAAAEIQAEFQSDDLMDQFKKLTQLLFTPCNIRYGKQSTSNVLQNSHPREKSVKLINCPDDSLPFCGTRSRLYIP